MVTNKGSKKMLLKNKQDSIFDNKGYYYKFGTSLCGFMVEEFTRPVKAIEENLYGISCSLSRLL
ncbi:MAG: hypothetical protein PQ612_00220 [Rickettsiales bacterium]|nr:hypothetical protein [Pseudomonadota bacterium]MDA0965659.1 hypothetical protein [Pseudomonadota bacterium]MDG4542983.1 hypothetical protein [Rickettsiales bacterium]MDG4544569.1 hypothetical protein [Rickettsiales bacterium]MDG4546691.1 hypothetical protein [Rickettsiales bacterium]